jgi:hypothetical protein
MILMNKLFKKKDRNNLSNNHRARDKNTIIASLKGNRGIFLEVD